MKYLAMAKGRVTLFHAHHRGGSPPLPLVIYHQCLKTDQSNNRFFEKVSRVSDKITEGYGKEFKCFVSFWFYFFIVTIATAVLLRM